MLVRAERPDSEIIKVQARNVGDLTKVVVVQLMRGGRILHIIGWISVQYNIFLEDYT